MRITVPHQKSREEVVRLIHDASAQLLRPDLRTPVEITELRQTWSGPQMDFSFRAGVAGFHVPISGWIQVGDDEVIIDLTLPAIVRQFIPEEKLRTGIESKVAGLLNS
jgi:hypothetical protein